VDDEHHRDGGQEHVRHVIEEYVEHNNTERPHKSPEYRQPAEPAGSPLCRDGLVLCRERLGGLLKSYFRGAP
jgi:hypothetical protein